MKNKTLIMFQSKLKNINKYIGDYKVNKNYNIILMDSKTYYYNLI